MKSRGSASLMMRFSHESERIRRDAGDSEAGDTELTMVPLTDELEAELLRTEPCDPRALVALSGIGKLWTEARPRSGTRT